MNKFQNPENKENSFENKALEISKGEILAQEEAYNALSKLLQQAKVFKSETTGKVAIQLDCKNREVFERALLLFSLTSIFPYDDEKKNTISIDNHFDIRELIELGILDANLLSDEELSTVESFTNGDVFVEDVSGDLSKSNTRIILKPIKNLFIKKNKYTSQFDDMREDAEVESSFKYGDTSYLYRQSRKKYRRAVGGLVFEIKRDLAGKIIEREITREEQDGMLTQAQGGDVVVRNKFLLMNMGLVYFVALNFSQKFPGINQNDILQEALIRMNLCIDGYEKGRGKNYDLAQEIKQDKEDAVGEDEDKDASGQVLEDDSISKVLDKVPADAKFSTYAVFSMELHLLNYFNNHSTLIRIPIHIRNLLSKIKRIDGKYSQLHDGSVATPEKIADVLDIPEDKVRRLYKLRLLDNLLPLEDENGNELYESSDPGPGDSLFVKERRDLVDAAINDLSDGNSVIQEGNVTRVLPHTGTKRSFVLRARNSNDGPTLEDIGDRLDVTKERIRSHEAKAVRQLKSPPRIDRLVHLVSSGSSMDSPLIPTSGTNSRRREMQDFDLISMDVTETEEYVDQHFGSRQEIMHIVDAYNNEIIRINSVTNLSINDKKAMVDACKLKQRHILEYAADLAEKESEKSYDYWHKYQEKRLKDLSVSYRDSANSL